MKNLKYEFLLKYIELSGEDKQHYFTEEQRQIIETQLFYLKYFTSEKFKNKVEKIIKEMLVKEKEKVNNER